ncbi:hypothetical protein LJC08_05040 [Methanimicrococcus sp. OttesenSCG-928-J09]|nr:hypothetical protein [Methanimicrococcus sp. OttesenSCG-928-J09]
MYCDHMYLLILRVFRSLRERATFTLPIPFSIATYRFRFPLLPAVTVAIATYRYSPLPSQARRRASCTIF